MAKQSFVTGQVLTAAQLTSLQQTAMSGGAASAKTASYTLVAADAGTAISMTSTSATTITVNTGLFAAGDTVFIQNLGTANLTITPGTATVNTAGSLILPQYDAGILYFVSASSAVFYDYIQVGAASPLTTKGDLYTFSTSDTRLGVGANGTTLVADSGEATGLRWSAPSSGALTLIQRSTFSNVANTSTTFDGVFTSTYSDYLVVFQQFYSATTADDLHWQWRYGGNTDTGQYATLLEVGQDSTTWTKVYSGNAGAVATLATDSESGFPFVGTLHIAKIGTGTYKPSMYGMGHEKYNGSLCLIYGDLDVARAFNGFILKSASSNVSGTVAVYGLANS